MKKFLLIAGDGYYPSSGTGDWVGCFSSYEEAESKVEGVEKFTLITKGPLKGQKEYSHTEYRINGGEYLKDWYKIVDLDDWIN
jgi:hypothetical protein